MNNKTMNTAELLATVIDALEDIKAQSIEVFDTSTLTSLFERVIVCTGTSNRQTRALASNIREKVKGAGEEILGVEGEDTGEWVLVDMGTVVVHIMQAPIREYYRLEELWGAHPLELAACRKPAVKPVKPARKVAVKKASFVEDTENTEDAVNQAPAKPTVARKVAAKKVAAATTDSKLVAKKVAAKKVLATPAARKRTIG